jgi:hypothetical protein
MDEFEKYVFTEFTNAVKNLQHAPYAIGLDIYCVDDDLRKPAVRLLTNTHDHAEKHFPNGERQRRGDAFSELEALWNNSYWNWKTEVTVGNEYSSFEGDYHDAKGIVLRKKWIESLGLWYEDQFEESNFDEALEIGGKINEYFDELCLKLARSLHSVLKTDLPIIFFNRESPDNETIILTFLANPRHLLDGYIAFIREGCGNDYAEFLEQDIDKSQLSYLSLGKGI